MTVRNDPVITAINENLTKGDEDYVNDYTRVTFSPDLAKFGMTSLTGDILK
jgi:hypothetical protein